MRLPLGILSGVGFIGAGSILRKDGFVHGLTTAATLWFVTVIGLCAGGGQIALAIDGLVLGLVVLWGLGRLEHKLPRSKRASLTFAYDPQTHARSELVERLTRHGCQVESSGLQQRDEGRLVEERFDIHWRSTDESDAAEREMASIVCTNRHAASWSLDE
jgi:putative Mg2+ transporter-C (MgtC) family protein